VPIVNFHRLLAVLSITGSIVIALLADPPSGGHDGPCQHVLSSWLDSNSAVENVKILAPRSNSAPSPKIKTEEDAIAALGGDKRAIKRLQWAVADHIALLGNVNTIELAPVLDDLRHGDPLDPNYIERYGRRLSLADRKTGDMASAHVTVQRKVDDALAVIADPVQREAARSVLRLTLKWHA